MELADYLWLQKQDFIRAFFSALYPVGVRNPLDLSRLSTPSSGWYWDAALGTQNAFVRIVEDQYKEYWVDVTAKDYREAFKQFLQAEYDVSPESVVPDLHVDHMLNKAFAQRHGIRFVRVALVPQAYNLGWGGKIERLLTRSIAADKPMYLFDYFIFMKVINILPPLDETDYRLRRMAIAHRICAETKMSIELVLQGLDGMFKLWPVF